MTDLYKLLGVGKNATKEQIRNAYYRLAKKLHPDKGKGSDAAAFKAVAFAYSILSDTKSREKYDNGEDVENVDNAQAKLMQNLSELVVKAIQKHDVKYTDMVEIMRNELDAALAAAEEMKGKVENAIKTVNEALSRFGGEKEVIEAILGQTLHGFERKKGEIENDVTLFKEMYARVKKLTYRTDKKEQKQTANDVVEMYKNIFGSGFGRL